MEAKFYLVHPFAKIDSSYELNANPWIKCKYDGEIYCKHQPRITNFWHSIQKFIFPLSIKESNIISEYNSTFKNFNMMDKENNFVNRIPWTTAECTAKQESLCHIFDVGIVRFHLQYFPLLLLCVISEKMKYLFLDMNTWLGISCMISLLTGIRDYSKYPWSITIPKVNI